MADATNILQGDQPLVESNVSSDTGALETSLDAIFGKAGDDKDTKGAPSYDTNNKTSVLQEPTGPTNWETVAKKFQSDYDKAQVTIRTKDAELAQYKPVAEFFNQLQEDPEVRHAFINEIEPELVKPKDPQTFIKESLVKEFGPDFDPENDSDRFKVRLYNLRMEQLYRDAVDNQNKKVPASLKELKEKRKAETEKKRQEAILAKQEVMTQLQWDESAYSDWLNWAQKIKPIELAKLKDRIDKTVNKGKSFRAPFLSNISGGSPVMPNQVKQELDYFFGAD